jgi:hypothetical protein
MNPRGAKQFGDFWLLREACKTVMTPRCKRALFGEGAILLTERMLPLRKCPVCGSPRLLRGEILDNAPPERGVAPGSGGSHGRDARAAIMISFTQ